jgi:hypothetical protein
MLLKFLVYKHLIFANSFAHAAAENLGILGSFFASSFPRGVSFGWVFPIKTSTASGVFATLSTF